MTKQQITKTLKNSNIDLTHIEIDSDEIEIFVEEGDTGTANDEATEKLMNEVSDALGGWGGYKTGYGAWILSEGYEVDDYDYCNPASPVHY